MVTNYPRAELATDKQAFVVNFPDIPSMTPCPCLNLNAEPEDGFTGRTRLLFMLQLCLKCSCPDNHRQKCSCSYLLLLTAVSPHLPLRAARWPSNSNGGRRCRRKPSTASPSTSAILLASPPCLQRVPLYRSITLCQCQFHHTCFFRIIKVFVGGCWSVTFLFYSYMKGAQVSASPASHSSPSSHTRAEIVQPLDGRVH